MSWSDIEIKYLKSLREESDMDWKEITEEMNEQFIERRTLNATRKAYKRYQDDEISDDVLIKNIKSTLTAKKTASKLRKENKAIVETLIGFDDVLEAVDTLKKIKIGKPKVKKKIKPSKKKKGMIIEALLSDLHYGLKTKSFDSGVLRLRMQKYTGAFIDAKDRAEKSYNVELLRILLNGDIIQSTSYHGAKSIAACDLTNAEQLAVAVESLFFDVILPIAKEGYPVEIIGMSGNHDRFLPDKFTIDPGKHYFTWTVYKGLENLCKAAGLKNVNFIIPLKAYHVYDCFGSKFLIEHGDLVKKGSSEALEKQLMRRSAQIGEILKGIRIGHFHNDYVGNVGRYIVNASPVSDDHYGDCLGYVSRPAQLINYYVETNKRDTSYFHTFVVNLG